MTAVRPDPLDEQVRTGQIRSRAIEVRATRTAGVRINGADFRQTDRGTGNVAQRCEDKLPFGLPFGVRMQSGANDACPVRSGSRRPKVDVISRLEASAIQLFASQGYEGTSLRDIAKHANVALSAIDRHFGSKLELFHEVHRKIWREISAERDALIREGIANHPERRLTLDAFLHAIIFPVAERIADTEPSVPVIRLLREFNSRRAHLGQKSPSDTVLIAERWVTTLIETCPGLSRMQAVWSYSFIIGVMFSTQLLDGWFDELLPPHQVDSAEISRVMVAYCSKGIEAVAQG